MVKIVVRERESFEEALRRFNKLIEKEGITTRAKENMYYTKPSKVKRDKINKARRRLEKRQRREK